MGNPNVLIRGDLTVITGPEDMALGNMSHITGEFDWWYGKIAPGTWAYVIRTEDANGVIGNPDWQELPLLLRTSIVAGLWRTLPA
jgi:hypothetical protein